MKRGWFVLYAMLFFFSIGLVMAVHEHGESFEEEFGGAERGFEVKGEFEEEFEREGGFEKDHGRFSFDQDRMHYAPDKFIEDPESYMQYCDNPEEMVEKLLEEMKRKGAFEQQCERMQKDFDHMQGQFEEDCERIKNEQQKYMPSKEEMTRHCENTQMFNPGNVQELSEEDKERMMREEDEEKERCKKRAEEEFAFMQEQQERYAEEHYVSCKERFDEEKEMFERRMKECGDGFSGDGMKEKMIMQGIEMCKKYDESGGNFFQAMHAAGDKEKKVLEEEYARIKMLEDQKERTSEDSGVMEKILQFLGFKKKLVSGLSELQKKSRELGVSIERLSAVASTLEDEKARNALEVEIQSLEEQRLALLAEIEALGHDVDAVGKGRVEEYPNEVSGFFLKVTDFLRGDGRILE